MAQGIFLPFPQHQRAPKTHVVRGVALLTLGSSNIAGITHCAYHLCPSHLLLPKTHQPAPGRRAEVPACMQLHSAQPPARPTGPQPCCTYLGRNHVISENQVICKIPLQGHGDGVESARGRRSEASARRPGQSPPPSVASQAQWQHPRGIWRQGQGSSLPPHSLPDFSFPATNPPPSPFLQLCPQAPR